MSTWYSAVVRCPACSHDFEARFVRGANASRAPELRDAALAGTLNSPACPSCGRSHASDAELVYADPNRGHWIAVARRAELARWAEVESTALAAFRTSLETAVAEAFAASHIRVVFDSDELRERLAIWESGLDDAVVECVKLACLGEQPGMRRGNERIRIARIGPERSLTLAIVEAAAPERVRLEVEVAPGTLERVAGEPEWRSRFPALFGAGFVSIDRYLR